MTSNIFFPVNGKITPTAYVIRLIATEILRGPSSDESMPFLIQYKPSAGISGKTRMDQKWYLPLDIGLVKYINLFMLLKTFLVYLSLLNSLQGSTPLTVRINRTVRSSYRARPNS
jgi:hypothetical protein